MRAAAPDLRQSGAGRDGDNPVVPNDSSTAHSADPRPLRFLGPAWFTIVMGLAGLALAWQRAEPVLGESALGVALVLAAAALAVFVLLGVLSLLRLRRHPQAVAEDLRHPGRHVMFAAIPLALILVATLFAFFHGPSLLARALWLAGSGLQLLASVWVLARWLQPQTPSGFAWPALTPAFLIPGVGNAVAAFAGPTLGFAGFAAAQLGVGIALWVLVMALLVVRLGLHGPWAVPQLPATFITVAPPSVMGTALLLLGAPAPFAIAFWGVAALFLAWSATVARRLLEQEFGIGFWALAFPLAAFTGLTLRLGAGGGPLLRAGAIALLALTSLVVLGLAWATVQGLRQRRILRAEAPPAMAPRVG